MVSDHIFPLISRTLAKLLAFNLEESHAYFKKMGNGEFRLTRVRDVAEPAERFAIGNGNRRMYQRRKARIFF